MRRWIVSLVAAAAVFGGVIAGASPAGANHAWGNYHWARTSNPFNLSLGDNVTSAWDGHLLVASSDWSASSVLNTAVVAGGTSLKTCKPTSGRVEVCNAKYGRNGWLGIAQIWASGSHITQGVVKLNDTYFTTASYNTPAWRNLVMCQEVGHTFGLGHQDEGFGAPNLGTCMDYTNDPDGGGAYGPANEHPNSHDYAQLETIYSHLDSTTTIGASTATANNRQDDWGRAISKGGPNGQADEYEKDLGNGQVMITHVFWADGGHTHDH